MATQRLIAATVAGEAGRVVSRLFVRWRASSTQGDEEGATRQAAQAWPAPADPSVVVLIRQVLGASASDEDVRASLVPVPGWLTAHEQEG